MKSLRKYLEDFLATPMNTIGMGNVSAPGDDQLGSGDTSIFGTTSTEPIDNTEEWYIDPKTGKKKRKKRFKRYKI